MIAKRSQKEAETMIQGGKILSAIKNKLVATVAPGVTGRQIDTLARELILSSGAKVSFEMEPGYKWAICIDINDGVVHGIPTDYPFKSGDVVGIDVGLFFGGFHTDTTISVGVGKISKENALFLSIGKKTLDKAINVAQPGRRIVDISKTIAMHLKKAGYSPVDALSGHGIGRKLHEDPYIPCLPVGNPKISPVIEPGMALAIEVIYTAGNGQVGYQSQLSANGQRGKSSDGWTIVSLDGTIAAVFEDTILITEAGPRVLTRG